MEGGGSVYENILPGNTASVASLLAKWPAMNQFYLSGGTALALHLGHRQSEDLDFFTRDPLRALPALAGLDDVLTGFDQVQWMLHTTEQIEWRLNGVSVTLLAYPFSHRFEFHSWRGLAVADARDIAVQKAYTLGRRAQVRDYLDLHAILVRKSIILDDMIRFAQDSYGDAFSARLFLQQLTYTDDLPDRDTALSRLVNPESFDTVCRDLAKEVEAWAQRRFGYSNGGPR